MNLDEAIELALKHAPEIAKSKAVSGAAEGARRQSTAWENPQLSIEAENIGGSGDYRAYDSAETTASVSQLIEIGGKVSARRSMAERDQALARLEERNETLKVVRNVKIAFARASASQEQLGLARDQSRQADDILSGVKRRVDAAADPIYQKNKARIAKASSLLAFKKAEKEKDVSFKNLSQMIGSKVEKIETKGFYALPKPAAFTGIEPDLVITREDIEIEKSKASYALERANAVPDPTISAGIRNFREDNENAFIIGVSLPIPVLNLNRGNIQKAGYEIAARDAQRQEVIREARAEIIEREKYLSDAYEEALSLKNDILPEAEAALKEARRGYGAGSFAYIDVLDAQRTFAESRIAYLDALYNYHSSLAELEYLTSPVSPETK